MTAICDSARIRKLTCSKTFVSERTQLWNVVKGGANPFFKGGTKCGYTSKPSAAGITGWHKATLSNQLRTTDRAYEKPTFASQTAFSLVP